MMQANKQIENISGAQNVQNKHDTNKNNNEVVDKQNEQFEYKEGGYGWVVVVATGYCFGILIGMLNNYSLLYNELDRVYNNTQNHVLYSGIQSFITLF